VKRSPIQVIPGAFVMSVLDDINVPCGLSDGFPRPSQAKDDMAQDELITSAYPRR